jgi:hypothetical protein
MTYFAISMLVLHGLCLLGTLLPPQGTHVGLNAAIHSAVCVWALAVLLV